MRLPAAAAMLLVSLLAACGSGGGGGGAAIPSPDPTSDSDLPAGVHTRYSLANACYALRSASTGKYVAAAGAGYAASAAEVTGAKALYFKPAALGSFLLYNTEGTVLNAAAPVANVSLDAAASSAIWTVKALGDTTPYPPTPTYDAEPSRAQVDAWRAFDDPFKVSANFRLLNGANALQADGTGALTIAAASADGTPAETFSMERITGCKTFPEAEDNTIGQTFKGRTPDGRVLGMADVHVHVSSTTFLGHALVGAPYSPFGVSRALPNCSTQHGQDGSRDVIGTFLGGAQAGHATDGWPTFSFWPSREALTHQAIYWKWLERGWKAGLRVLVNDLVENGTLCELQKNNSNDPTIDCNEMKSAGRQVGTMYGMQDYIDAQYGGPGAGWFRIVQSPAEARAVIEKGKLAVVLGIEISNFLNCQVTYQPGRMKEPFQEDGSGGTENSYACKMTETGAADEILTQMDKIHGWGVRQVISIHEFDNAFGGNGVFFPIINLGNRENSGGIPSGTSSEAFDVSATPTGEYWTTYNCPVTGTTANFSGYLWDSSGGANGKTLRSGTNPPCNPGNPSQCVPPPPGPPACQPAGQGGRYGGSTLCYPDTQQCNARWMTPIGRYMYTKLMEKGFIFDFDHMELHMKSQALDLTEAQPIAYPIVSTHGTFGGTSLEQTRRVLKNGGFIYPSLGGSGSFRNDMAPVRAAFDTVNAGKPGEIFGFGFGTDTNGLSGQAGAEDIKVGGTAYPYTLFTGGVFARLPDFVVMNSPVQFDLSQSHDAAGTLAKSWDIAQVGSAHYGMLSDFVEAINVHGTPEEMAALFNSAERYLRTWQRTLDARDAILATPEKKATVPAGVLVAAPKPGQPYPAGD